MSVLRHTLENCLKFLCDQRASLLLLNKSVKGIEKENLRATNAAQIAQTSHPLGLGSSLTHPFITTDYSESLLEIVTPPVTGTDKLLSWLEKLHTYIYPHIENELLWAPSMPCVILDPKDIPIAQYGDSHQGRMRTLYRVGLGHRYEKKMQTIAGIHFNYSFPEEFLSIWRKMDDKNISNDQAYFGLLRNYLRYGWLIDYLFGASSCFDHTFISQAPSIELKKFKEKTYYAPYACSLRMSDLGYHNKTQKELRISFNSVNEYAQNLAHAISTPYPPYEEIFKKYGMDSQINANLLQIEAEYYAPIRPKRVVAKSQRQSQALLAHGVEYVEVRAIDINPYDPLGISKFQMHFTEMFLLYCLLTDSPQFSEKDYQTASRNTQKVVLEGRKPACELQHALTDENTTLQNWAFDIFIDLEKIADFLDKHTEDKPYANALKYFHERIKHPELLISAIMLDDLFENHHSFIELGLSLSEKNKHYFMSKQLTSLENADLNQLAQESLQQQRLIKAQQTGSFEQFLTTYYS